MAEDLSNSGLSFPDEEGGGLLGTEDTCSICENWYGYIYCQSQTCYFCATCSDRFWPF